MSISTLRGLTLALCAGGFAFWIYTFSYIAHLPPGDGSGFHWLGEVPLTAITLAMILPAALLALSRRALPAAAALAAVGVVLYALLWIQLLSEFAP